MNLHEYQSKALFSAVGIPVPPAKVASSVEHAVQEAKWLGGERWVVKAQVHAGGRGKAGGVKIVTNLDDLRNTVEKLLGSHLVTYQTDSKGQLVSQVLIEAPCDIGQELYLSLVIDRSSRRVVIVVSKEGGVDIEKVSENAPERIYKVIVEPLMGVLPYQGRLLAFHLGLTDKSLQEQFIQLLQKLYTLFIQKDLSLVEINPLVITKDNKLLCLDAKVQIDDNALYRQTDLFEMRDESQSDPRESHARAWEINYIPLEGNIGCMVNGAGLAMATMDLIKLSGGDPANFLDVGGNATRERVTEAFKIITSDPNVKAVLINIFGGIVRCDLIADGILEAMKEVNVTVPVVARLEGNQAAEGAKKLNESGLKVIAALSLAEAAEQVVKVAQ